MLMCVCPFIYSVPVWLELSIFIFLSTLSQLSQLSLSTLLALSPLSSLFPGSLSALYQSSFHTSCDSWSQKLCILFFTIFFKVLVDVMDKCLTTLTTMAWSSEETSGSLDKDSFRLTFTCSHALFFKSLVMIYVSSMSSNCHAHKKQNKNIQQKYLYIFL